jgi:hypothetical protein
MDGVGGTSIKRFLGNGRSLVEARGGFRPNAAGAITVTRGPLAGMFTVAYSATGIYTVTMTATGWKFPPTKLPLIRAHGSMVDITNTNRFTVYAQGGFVNSSRSFILKAWQDTAAFAVPSDPLNWIDFFIEGEVA